MKRIKTIAIITAVAMLISMMPMMAFASTSAPAKANITSLYQSGTSQATILKWSKVSKADGYQIARKAEGGTYKVVKTITKGSTVKFTSSKLTLGKTYYYKVRAYKKSGKKKIYGKYSDSKNVTVVRVEPKIIFDKASLTNSIDGTNVVTKFTFKVDSKCAPIKISNQTGDTNSVIRFTGIDEAVYTNAMTQLSNILLTPVTDYVELADGIIKALAGEYSAATMTPDKIMVGTKEVAKEKTYTLKPGQTYEISFVSALAKKVPNVNLSLKEDAGNGEPGMTLTYGKETAGEMYYQFDNPLAAYAQGAYMIALQYRGDYYDATMMADIETGEFGLDIANWEDSLGGLF